MRSNSYCNGPGATAGESASGPACPASRTLTGVRLGGKEYGSYPELA